MNEHGLEQATMTTFAAIVTPKMGTPTLSSHPDPSRYRIEMYDHALLTRDPDSIRRAISLYEEYGKTLEAHQLNELMDAAGKIEDLEAFLKESGDDS